MTTSPSKHAFTAGPAWVEGCEQCPERGRIYIHAKGMLDPNELIAEAVRTDRDVDNGDVAEAEANADLIAEAFTVTHETGLTPRQLAERCKELEGALTRAVQAHGPFGDDTRPEWWNDANAVIAKTGGAK